VIKGKRMPGRMGGVRQTIINLQVVRVDAARNLIFVKGGVPGARDGFVFITK
jgi:large subunit ribosomal protein L3